MSESHSPVSPPLTPHPRAPLNPSPHPSLRFTLRVSWQSIDEQQVYPFTPGAVLSKRVPAEQEQAVAPSGATPGDGSASFAASTPGVSLEPTGAVCASVTQGTTAPGSSPGSGCADVGAAASSAQGPDRKASPECITLITSAVALEALFRFLHGTSASGGVPAAAKAYEAAWVPSPEATVPAASPPASGEKRKRAASASTSKPRPPAKALIERTIKAYASAVKSVGSAKVWEVSPKGWEAAEVSDPPALVLNSAAEDKTAASSIHVSADHGSSVAVIDGAEDRADGSSAGRQAASPAAADGGSSIPAPKTALPDPRAAIYAAAAESTGTYALIHYCGYSASTDGPAVLSRTLGSYAADAHTTALVAAAVSHTVAPPPAASSSAAALLADTETLFPSVLSVPASAAPLLALLIQGAAAPLPEVVRGIAQVISLAAASAVPAGAVPSWAAESELLKFVPLLAERKAYGVKPKADSPATSTLHRWEVANDLFLTLPASDAPESELQEDVASVMGGAAGSATAAEKKTTAAASSETRRVVAAVHRERTALHKLGDVVRSAVRLVDLLSPGTGVPDEVKVEKAVATHQKALLEWTSAQEKERARAAKATADAAARAAKAAADAATRAAAREAKEAKAAAARAEKDSAKAAEKSEKKIAAEKAKGIFGGAAFMATFFKKPQPPQASASVVAASPEAPAVAASVIPPTVSEDLPSAPQAAAPSNALDAALAAVTSGVDFRETAQSDFAAWVRATSRELRTARARKRAVKRSFQDEAASSAGFQSGRVSASPSRVTAAAQYGSSAFVDLTLDDSDVGAPSALITAGLVPGRLCRAKTLSFHEDTRLAYFGTWAPSRAGARLSRAAAAAAAAAEAARASGIIGDGEDDGIVDEPYVSVAGRKPRVNGRCPIGVRTDLIDYAIDSEAEWEEGGDGGEGHEDLERASDGADEEDELEAAEEAGGEVPSLDALDYADGWLCPDDHLEFDADALARDRAARSAAAAADAEDADGRGDSGDNEPIPGDDDADILSVTDGRGASDFNPAAMPCAAPSALVGLKRQGDTTTEARPAKRRIILPSSASTLADVRDFSFGWCTDLPLWLATSQLTSASSGAARDLLGGAVIALHGNAAPLQLSAPDIDVNGELFRAGEEHHEDEAAAQEGDTDIAHAAVVSAEVTTHVAAQGRPSSSFPADSASLAALVKLADGSCASMPKIVEAWRSGAPERASVSKSAVEAKLREISVKGRYGLSAAAPSPDAASAVPAAEHTAVPEDARVSPYVSVELLPYIRATMAAEGLDASANSFTRMRFIVHESVRELAGVGLPPEAEAAAVALAAFVEELPGPPSSRKIPTFASTRVASQRPASGAAASQASATLQASPAVTATRQSTLSFSAAAKSDK